MSMIAVLNASENDQYIKLKHTAALVSITSVFDCQQLSNDNSSFFFLLFCFCFRFCFFLLFCFVLFYKKRIPIIMENFPADASDYCENLLETLLNMSNSLSIEV